MKTFKYTFQIKSIVILLAMALLPLLNSCEDFVEADPPFGQINQDEVFQHESTATAAITSLYAKLRDEVLLTGNTNGTSVLFGFYTDELDYYAGPGSAFENFYNHQVLPSNEMVSGIWKSSYNLTYMCNAAIEGLENSSLPSDITDQLKGEALFIRAMVHFYLVNIFGDIPYIQSTNYLVNQDVSRMHESLVYEAIILDLEQAKALLSEQYPSSEKTRANKYAATALLARVYLYTEHWQNAEVESSILLNQSSFYDLEPSLENEFLKNSTSAIMQLKPRNEGDNTREAISFLFQTPPPSFMALSPVFVNAFEPGDLRRSLWIKEVSDGNQSWYAPYKYKRNENTGATQEYSIVFRLSEQYLIRSEARLQMGNLAGALEDLNAIRQRAGLSTFSSSNVSEILNAILNERKAELFTEHGHRWFDLKRMNRASEVLTPIKPNWRATDVLLPLPESELLMNPNLEPQNPGY